jgi:potassium-transporting ATPase KdpC subunit
MCTLPSILKEHSLYEVFFYHFILQARRRLCRMSEEAENIEEGVESEEPPSGAGNVGRKFLKATRAIGIVIGRDTWGALKLILILLLLCGVVFPLVVFSVGQIAFPEQANGSLIRDSQGRIVGSKLLGQQFTRSEYFHGRPSAVGYNAASSGGSNLGPTNAQLIQGNGTEVTVAAGTPAPADSTPVAGKPGTYYVPGSYLGVKNYAAQFRQENGLSPDTPLPADIITASGSGLDPDISVEAALLQVNRVVAARQVLGGGNAAITAARVRELIAQNTQGRDLGILGEPRVNVLVLNLALDALYGAPSAR